MQIEQWQIDMARRPQPAVSTIVPGSTPVLSFGDVLRAEVATIGINPSRIEFDDGGWLRGARRRLATLESLHALPGESLSEEQARHIVMDCNLYFERNPYWAWFKPLDELLKQAIGVNYRDGTACHLDLVQWATDPVWGGFSDRAEKRLLLEEGVPHLEAVLRESDVHLVLAAGAAVVKQLSRTGTVQWEEVCKIPMAGTTCTVFQGVGDGVNFIGWSSNIQSQPGANSHAFRARLADEVAKLATPVLTTADELASEIGLDAAPVIELDQKGYLPPAVTVSGKTEFAEVLRTWHDDGQATTVGDVSKFGGRPCIAVDLGGRQAVLNADTKRAAVASYLRHVRRHGADAPWRVVSNARGNVNKVIFSDDPADSAGWYLYLREPCSAPREL